jgi:hypothetical protein
MFAALRRCAAGAPVIAARNPAPWSCPLKAPGKDVPVFRLVTPHYREVQHLVLLLRTRINPLVLLALGAAALAGAFLLGADSPGWLQSRLS